MFQALRLRRAEFSQDPGGTFHRPGAQCHLGILLPGYWRSQELPSHGSSSAKHGIHYCCREELANSTTYMVLILQEYGMQELWGHGSFLYLLLRYKGKTCEARESFAQRWSHHRVCSGRMPSRAMGVQSQLGPGDRATSRVQNQPGRVAMEGELPVSLLPVSCAQVARLGVLSFTVCLAGFQSSFGPDTPFYFPISLGEGNVYPIPSTPPPPSTWEIGLCFADSQV